MPNGLMYTMPPTATPPLAPRAGGGGFGYGLFGGSPYPVDPSMRQGLMQDAWRQFGMQLLANAQNPDIGQGLAQALAAGRQAYAGGAQEAYQVGRQERQDKQYQEWRQGQIQASEALAEQRRQDAEKAQRDTEQAAAERAQAGEQIREMLEGMSAEERAAFQRARLLGQQGLPSEVVSGLSMSVLPEEPAPANWRAVPGVPGMVFNPTDPTQTMRVATPTAPVARTAPDKPAGLSPTKIAQMLASNMSMLDRKARENQAYDAAGNPIVPPPHVIRAQAEQLLRQQIAAVGRATGSPGPTPVQSPESVLEAAGVPPEARTPAAIQWVSEQLAARTREEIIEELSGGG